MGGGKMFPRSVFDGDKALFSYNNQFCWIWKCEGISFKQTIKELKDSFIIVDMYITEENVNSHFKNENTPKNIESHLSNFIVYDLETRNEERARPFSISFYRLIEKNGRYKRDPTQDEIQKSIEDTIAFGGDKCFSNA